MRLYIRRVAKSAAAKGVGVRGRGEIRSVKISAYTMANRFGTRVTDFESDDSQIETQLVISEARGDNFGWLGESCGVPSRKSTMRPEWRPNIDLYLQYPWLATLLYVKDRATPCDAISHALSIGR